MDAPKRKGAGARSAAKRLAARDWEIAALQMIGEKGLAGLAIEPLAKRLGVTKGSFYWHFASPQALLEASLARWERVFTDRKYAALEETPDPVARLHALFGDVAGGDPALGVFHALSLEQGHPTVGPVFRRVARKRLRFLQSSLEEIGLSRSAAGDRALLLYSAYIGFLQAASGLSSSELSARRRQRIVDGALRLLLPEVEAEG